MDQLIAVAVPPLTQELTYRVPEKFTQSLHIGQRVSVPLGRRFASGFVVRHISEEEEKQQTGFAIKDITAVEGVAPCFDPEQLTFFKWVADYYQDSLSNVIDAAVPPRAAQKFRRFLTLKDPDAETTGSVQKKIIEFIKGNHEVEYSKLSRQIKGCSAAVKALIERGVIEERSEEAHDHYKSAEPLATWAKREVLLNHEQQSALERINAAAQNKNFMPLLLHGITGSGKTEVYIEAVEEALSHNLGSLIIVPEIALTPQLIERFRARLGDDIAVLHSALAKRVRWDSWRALVEGRARIAIGARSGVFAPVPNLGLIIVDEEHDGSYKQSEGLRYNARDLAVVRARLRSCPVVLGSATPSLESFQRSLEKKYEYKALPVRHGNSTKLSIEIVDLNKIKPWEMISKTISPRFNEALKDTIQKGEQVFVMYNRRGFASYLQCEKCEFICECPNCSVTMTFHRQKNALVCHYCSFTNTPSRYCPKCNDGKADPTKAAQLVQRGAGTEKVFEELRELFPTVVIDRLDRDSASSAEEYRGVLDRMRSRETQILVGTQMIAKGHDLPDVTLVGVADCDVGLHMPDFRAGERAFQLLTQVAGRAGRGAKPGHVILQTRVPNHLSLLMTVNQDYQGFATRELVQRKGLLYPPFCRLLRVLVSSPDQNLPRETLLTVRHQIEHILKHFGESARILGPAPAALERIKGEWRWHLLCKSESPSLLNKILKVLREHAPSSKKLKIIFDIDPQDLL